MLVIDAPSKSPGFTLLELVIVMALISILAISIAGITGQSVSGYIDAKDRNRQSQDAKRVLERISREIREALPQSVRTGTSGGVSCVEFMSIDSASSELDMPDTNPVTSFHAVAFDLTSTFTPGQLMALMPMNAAEIYAGSGVTAAISSIVSSGVNQVLVTLSGATAFARRSPQGRFFLLDGPVSFCLDNNSGELRRYSGYAMSASQNFPPPGSSSLFAHNFAANGTVFNYQPGSLQNAALLQMNFFIQNRNRNLSGTSESIEVFHEVHIRNVP